MLSAAGVLEEGLANVRKKYLHTQIVDQATFNMLLDIDPTPNKKYVDWIFKSVYNEEKNADNNLADIDLGVIRKLGANMTHYIDAVNRKKIKNTDINQYKSIDAFITAVHDVKDTKSKGEIKKEKQAKDAEDGIILLDDDDYKIVIPTSITGSRRYARGADWCIAYQGQTQYWNEYIHDYSLLPHFVLNKKLPTSTPTHHSCVMVSPGDEIHSVWDYTDHQLDSEQQADFFDDLRSKGVDVDEMFTHDEWDEIVAEDNDERRTEAIDNCNEIIDSAELEHSTIVVDDYSSEEDHIFVSFSMDVTLNDVVDPPNDLTDGELKDVRNIIDDYVNQHIDDISYYNGTIHVHFSTDPTSIGEAEGHVESLITDAGTIDEEYNQMLRSLVNYLEENGLVDTGRYGRYIKIADEISEADDDDFRGMNHFNFTAYEDDDIVVSFKDIKVYLPTSIAGSIAGDRYGSFRKRYGANESGPLRKAFTETIMNTKVKTAPVYDPKQELLPGILPKQDAGQGIISEDSLSNVRELLNDSIIVFLFRKTTVRKESVLHQIEIYPKLASDMDSLLVILESINTHYNAFMIRFVDTLNERSKNNPFSNTSSQLSESKCNEALLKVYKG